MTPVASAQSTDELAAGSQRTILGINFFVATAVRQWSGCAEGDCWWCQRLRR